MQRVTVICVGKLKEKFYLAAAEEYAKRLSRHCTLEVVELPEQRLGESPTAGEIQRALQTEATAIRQKLPKGAVVIAMCVEGQLMSSEALAQQLMRLGLEGSSHLAFLIGGSFGLDEELKRQAALRLSMSPMTFPHHLARVMLLEQIYRGYQILEGSRYHK